MPPTSIGGILFICFSVALYFIKPLQKLLFFALRYGNSTPAFHCNVASAAFVVLPDVFQINKVSMMNPDKIVFSEYLFKFLQVFSHNDFLTITEKADSIFPGCFTTFDIFDLNENKTPG